MLIKIQKFIGSNTFMVIEGAKEVEYEKEPHYFYNEKELSQYNERLPGLVVLLLVGDSIKEELLPVKSASKESLFPSNVIRLNSLTYFDEDRNLIRIVFDGEAFICNDEGKTIHKIRYAEPLPQGSASE